MPPDRIGPPYWNDRPVIIVGAGPSLKGFDFSRFKGLGYVVGVNEAMFDLPFASAGVSADPPFMDRRAEQLRAVPFPLFLAPPEQREKTVEAIYLTRRSITHKKLGSPLSDDPTWLASGGTSGFVALGIAYLKRATEIFLFGFDYGRGESADIHYCPERYPRDDNERYWRRWARAFKGTVRQLNARGITVTNASPSSEIDAYHKCSLEQAVAVLQERAT